MPDKNVIDRIINAILQVIVPDKIILFGSQARNQARPDSDYDILVIKKDIEDELILERALYRNMIGVGVGVAVTVGVGVSANAGYPAIKIQSKTNTRYKIELLFMTLHLRQFPLQHSNCFSVLFNAQTE